MAKTCPITGEKVLYFHCMDCPQVCKKLKSSDDSAFISDEAVSLIKDASRKIGLNVHNWQDSSIQKTWRLFSMQNGEILGTPVSFESIQRYFRWLRDESGR